MLISWKCRSITALMEMKAKNNICSCSRLALSAREVLQSLWLGRTEVMCIIAVAVGLRAQRVLNKWGHGTVQSW